MGWVLHVARMSQTNTYKILVGKPEGKTHLESPDLDHHIIIIIWLYSPNRALAFPSGFSQQ
jgi:hypothetical protein